jgi:hypothetical protein
MSYEIDAKRGVANHYGARTTDGSKGAQQSTCNGIVKSAVWDFAYNNLPASGTSNLQFVIPANATIVSAKLYVDVAFTSTSTTTDLVVGLYNSAGVAIDADGLISASEATQTAIGTAGNVVTGAGALVGKTIGAAAGELVVAGTDTDLLTGKGRIVVEYVYDKN